MRLFLSSIIALLIFVSAVLIWFFLTRTQSGTPTQNTNNPSFVGTRPGVGNTTSSGDMPNGNTVSWNEMPTSGAGPLPDQPAKSGGQPVIVEAFEQQMPNATSSIVRTETTVVSTYALQPWEVVGTGGGAALFKYEPATGWKLLTMGGGVWSVESLVTVGVPRNDAEKLIAGLKWAN